MSLWTGWYRQVARVRQVVLGHVAVVGLRKGAARKWLVALAEIELTRLVDMIGLVAD